MLIELTKSKKIGVFTYVDDKYSELDKIGWSLSGGYAIGKFNGVNIRLHRVIMMLELGDAIPEGHEIDHINGDKLDNRVSNLRICTEEENKHNRFVQRNSSTKLKGVTKKGNKYQARIKTNNKRISLGYYSTKELAHEAYCLAADEYHKDFKNYG